MHNLEEKATRVGHIGSTLFHTRLKKHYHFSLQVVYKEAEGEFRARNAKIDADSAFISTFVRLVFSS